jgi:hypothetical protein
MLRRLAVAATIVVGPAVASSQPYVYAPTRLQTFEGCGTFACVTLTRTDYRAATLPGDVVPVVYGIGVNGTLTLTSGVQGLGLTGWRGAFVPLGSYEWDPGIDLTLAWGGQPVAPGSVGTLAGSWFGARTEAPRMTALRVSYTTTQDPRGGPTLVIPLTLTSTSVVPEPTTSALLSTGLLALGAVARRRCRPA